jgi:hypothetical protein
MKLHIALWVATAVLLSGCPEERAKAYDGSWWQSVDAYRRREFVEGYTECDRPGNVPLKYRLSRYLYEELITAHYQAKPAEAARPAAEVLLEINAANASAEIPPGGEGPYYNDGEYWRQAVPSGRLGWVEGYIACEWEKGGKSRFRQTPQSYVEKMSAFYEYDANEETINPAKEKVLMRETLLKISEAGR